MKLGIERHVVRDRPEILMAQADRLRKQGVPADKAARRVDLTSHRTDFPEIRQPGAEARGIRRLYEYLADREKQGRSGR
jgi:hypothetical protein